MKSYIVIGLGRFGGSLARQLCTLGAEVLAMDVHNDLVQQLANDVTHAVVGDARDKEVLRALGVRNFDCAVIAIGDDLAASVLITMNLKELGAPYIVCKAHDETHRLVLESWGLTGWSFRSRSTLSGWREACTPTMCWITSSFPRTTEFWKFLPPRAGSASASMS